jgi:pyruvate dehydrogenase E1 component beta subunit
VPTLRKKPLEVKMKKIKFMDAVNSALAQAMAEDPRILLMGEDLRAIRRTLYLRFGPDRVLNTPISEAAFLGAGVAAAMGGLRPVVELYMVDFLVVAVDALLNHAAKVADFSGGQWRVPLVLRTTCSGGYGDGGQHGQSLWGWIAHIPGLSVVVPSNPADAGGLMLAALEASDPVVLMEPKLLCENWLDYLGGGSRPTVEFDIPKGGAVGEVPTPWQPVPLGVAAIKRHGQDLTIISLGVSVHRALDTAEILSQEGIQAEVIDLRTVSPLDRETILESVAKTRRMLVVDEDYQGFGLSGELSAIALEEGLNFGYRRVCTQGTIPFNQELEDQALPNTQRILTAARELVAATDQA